MVNYNWLIRKDIHILGDPRLLHPDMNFSLGEHIGASELLTWRMPLTQARLVSRELRSAIYMHTGFIISTFHEIKLDEESSTSQLFCLV